MDPGTMLWILALGGVGIVVGLATYGYKIMNAMGVKLIAITPSRGSCIELGAALVVIYGTGQGWPLSTTHCQIGATVAVGLFAVWKSTSIATPSNRRRVDGVDVDAKIQRERAINFDFHTGCLKAVRASTPGCSPSAASAGSSRSSSSARRPRSSSGPRPSRSRASTATTTARSTPASGCSERSSFPARPGHQRYRPNAPWSSRSTRGARATAYVHS